MELQQAQKIASQVIQTLKPFCERIEVAGSIRRKRPFVHDIDLVCI
jgi:DNA polymerase/3'-5' exonuclease PolX